MPLHNLGYRSWEGARTSRHMAWLVIASTGVALAWKSRWLTKLVFISWLPAAYLALGIFAFEKAVEQPQYRGMVQGVLSNLPNVGMVNDLLDRDDFRSADGLVKARYRIWAFVLMTLLRYSQGVILVLLVGIVAMPLIGADLRSRAYLLYFSKPLAIWEYLLGKSAIVWTYLVLITTAPALLLYVEGVFLSADLRVLQYTWDLPLRIFLASALLIVPTTAIALCVSSLFQENRNAMFAWFAIWILGWVIYGNMAFATGFADGSVREGWWSYLSLYHVMGTIQAWVFGLASRESLVPQKALLLLLVTVAACVLLYRRSIAPTRV